MQTTVLKFSNQGSSASVPRSYKQPLCKQSLQEHTNRGKCSPNLCSNGQASCSPQVPGTDGVVKNSARFPCGWHTVYIRIISNYFFFKLIVINSAFLGWVFHFSDLRDRSLQLTLKFIIYVTVLKLMLMRCVRLSGPVQKGVQLQIMQSKCIFCNLPYRKKNNMNFFLLVWLTTNCSQISVTE